MFSNMRLNFTKMQGAGNDFVVIDATREAFALSPAQVQQLGDRRFGVGCDQVLVIEPATAEDHDFRYRIFNGGSGDEVEHCGNGARCFVRFCLDHGLTEKTSIRVRTVNNLLRLDAMPDGRVRVDMGPPVFEPARVPFVDTSAPELAGLSVLSMGNPHAVLFVDDVDTAPVEALGQRIQALSAFPQSVNVGFLQVLDRSRARIRVYERGAGETLACGTGACAAVVAGIRAGRLDAAVEVQARGGLLRIEWDGAGPVFMTGPAETVFEGSISL
jgi:diaminopimelate epimerase